jgi:HPt (histidine-containing phosphotransfer) domain-containing protein
MIGLVERLACRAAPAANLPAAQLPAEGEPPADAVSRAAATAFDPDEALSRCFDTMEMLRGMIRSFFEDADRLFPQMRDALARGDLVEVGRLGHRMKGTAVYLGAEAAARAALRVERFFVGGGTPSEAEEAVNALERECIVLKSALREHPLASV